MGGKRVDYVLLHISMVPPWGGQNFGQTQVENASEINKKRYGRLRHPVLVVCEIGMFSLDLPEVLPPTT